MLLDEVDSLKSIILLNKSYEDFIEFLNTQNAPKDDFEKFVGTIVYLYTSEDFFAILAIIDKNIDKFVGFDASNIVFREIIREIMNDYINQK